MKPVLPSYLSSAALGLCRIRHPSHLVMVKFRNITISLRSQYDVLALPEFAPSPNSNATSTPSRPDTAATVKPQRDNEPDAQVVMFVPIYESSQFWVDYYVEPADPAPPYFYFKLFFNSTSFISWGIGKEDCFKGTTMNGLFKKHMSKKLGKDKGAAELEKRSFFFSRRSNSRAALEDIVKASPEHISPNDEMEIKVYRATARRPASEHIEAFKKARFKKRVSAGIELVNAGSIEDEHPRSYWDYALMDPPDRPYATFRYVFCIWVCATHLKPAPLSGRIDTADFA